jgi:hypothetical protein
MSEREFTEEERAEYAEGGHALPDGSYPMPDCDAVQRAIDGYGRAPESHREDLAAMIHRRNEELDCGLHFDPHEHGGEEKHGDHEEGDHEYR